MDKPASRQEFMTTVGFALYTEVNDKLLGNLSMKAAAPVEEQAFARGYTNYIKENPAGTGLCVVMNQLMSQIPRNVDSAVYGVTREDHKRALGNTFNNGFGDLNFTWHFAAGLANATADFFVKQGVLTQEQKDSFTLHDWANIIGSGWFSRLAHLLALTKNGTYGSFGRSLSGYKTGSFAEQMVTKEILADAGDTLFEYNTKLEPTEGLMYATASLAKKPLQNLRKTLKSAGDSVGCPVARYAVRLPKGLIKTDPHTRALIDNHALAPTPERSDDQYTHFTQEWSAIDKTLAFFAWQLDDYEQRHGTPRFEIEDLFFGSQAKLKHVRGEQPVDALRWQPPATSTPSRIGAVTIEHFGEIPRDNRD